MSAGRNQHYVPQFYFRRFSNDDSIRVMVRKTGYIPPTAASISGQASKSFFYGSAEVEKTITSFEIRAISAIGQLGRLESPTRLPPQEVGVMFQWLVFQRNRTMAARQSMRAMTEWLAEAAKQIAINNSESIPDDQKSEWISALKVKIDPAKAQLIAMSAAVDGAAMLGDLTPFLLHNRTNRPFLFGDSPVVFYNLARHHITYRGALGFQSPGLLVFYPLSERKMLMLVDDYLYKLKAAAENRIFLKDLKDVASLNKLQLHAAASAIYFADEKYAAYVRSLWDQEHSTLNPHEGVTREAPGFSSETGKSIGDIFHAYERQIPHRLLLSFLTPYDDRRSADDMYFNARSQR